MTLICEECCCINTSDNPVITIVDDIHGTTEHLCMICAAERLDYGE